MSEDVVVRPEPGPLEYAPVGNLALWTGVLAGPTVFLLLLETNYVVSTEYACPSSVWWPMHAVDAVAVILTALALLLSWRNWVASGRQWPVADGGSVERARFLSALGVLVSAGFILVMIAQWIPVMILGPCQHS
ncbi:MAG TPA: hypothetical protein VFJ74_08120 [Gemmatimonadaceae bacterium]|nr:hypothetical protein [Gemmatimonadaceae bacterium]